MLPPEIISEILCLTNDFNLVCSLHCDFYTNYAYNHINKKEQCTWDYAAENGYLEVIKWLHANKKVGCTKSPIDYAAEYGHMEIVKWLHKNTSFRCTTDAIDYAAENGHLEIVKWIHNNIQGSYCTDWAMNFAACNGHLEVVKWLFINKKKYTYHAMAYAAAYGYLETVKFLYENNQSACSIETAIQYAERNNHYKVIEYLNSILKK